MAARGNAAERAFPWNAFRLRPDRTVGAGGRRPSVDRAVGPEHFSASRIFASPGRVDRWKSSRRGAKPWIAPADSPAAAAGGHGAFSAAARMALQPTTTVANVRLRIMQPKSGSRDVRFNYAAKAQVMQKYLTLSESRRPDPNPPAWRDVSILIWPESAFPVFPERAEADCDGRDRRAVAKRAPSCSPARLLRARICRPARESHAPTIRFYGHSTMTAVVRYCRFTTSCIWFRSASILPFQGLGWKKTRLRAAHQGFRGLEFIPGRGVRHATMEIPNAPRGALPLICYEAIFSRGHCNAGRPSGLGSSNLTK